MLTRGQRECGELFGFRLGPKPFVLFAGPEAHDAYFRSPDDQLDAKSVYRFTVPIFGRGVAYDVSPQLMTEQLGFLFPALRESSMRRFARIMFEETCSYADALDDAGELDHLGRGQQSGQTLQNFRGHVRGIERRRAGIGETGALHRVVRPVIGIEQRRDVVRRVIPALAPAAAGRSKRVGIVRDAVHRTVEGAAERRDAPLQLAVEMAGRVAHHRVVEPDQAFEQFRPVHVEPKRVGKEAHALLVGIHGGGEIAFEVRAVGVGDRGFGFVGHGAPQSR